MKKILLLMIILLAGFLRLYKLDCYPALNADEAAIGYNAYSLIQTGMDEHGNSWPVHFQSFNDYKPGLYFYIVLPFVKVFGLNALSVRLPNAMLSVASVFLIYLLVKELFEVRLLQKNKQISVDRTALIASFLLAISPWHIHFSRGGWEVNTSTFFILMGVLLFLKALKNNSLLGFTFCVLSFDLSLYTYHSARVVAPLIILGLLVFYNSVQENPALQGGDELNSDMSSSLRKPRLLRREGCHWKSLKKSIKPLTVSAVIGVLLMTPLILDFSKSSMISRAAGVGIFSDTGTVERTNEQRMEHGGVTSVILHNKVTNYGLLFLKNWGEHYHGLFLFISGDEIQRNHVPETGELYLFEIITVLIGLCFIFKTYELYPTAYSVILCWLVIAPIPAALTFQSPHALRAQNMIIPLTLISAIGLNAIIKAMRNKKCTMRFILYSLVIFLISWNFARYLHMYYLHMSKEYPFSSQYGVKELVDYLESQSRDYKNIVVTNKYDQPYILFLFYMKYPPEKFQKDHILTPKDQYGFSTVDKYSNFVFKGVDWDRDKLLYPDSLIIGAESEIPDEANVVKRIYGSNGYFYFKVVEN